MIWPLLLLLTAECSAWAPLSPKELTELARAEARWKARGFADYRYEMKGSCFCPAEINRWTRVTVRQGRVVAAEPVEPDSTLPVSNLNLWEPIDSLFGRLRQFARDKSLQRNYSDIVVEFDPILGFPTLVDWQSKPSIADGSATYWLRNVQGLRRDT